MTEPGRGRPRDADLDERILTVTRRHLAEHGYEGMSLVAVADEAGTTRQAIYRRWSTKADLATAAIAAMSRADERPPTDDPFADLVRELVAFRDGITRPDGLSMVGTMLLAGVDDDLLRQFRERIVQPRRDRLTAILHRAVRAGLLPRTRDTEADLAMAVNVFTGSWYAMALAGQSPPEDWPQRIARLAWRSLGGTPPRRR